MTYDLLWALDEELEEREARAERAVWDRPAGKLAGDRHTGRCGQPLETGARAWLPRFFSPGA